MQRIRDWRIWCWHHWWIPVMIIIMGSVVVVALFGNDGNIQRMEIIGNAFNKKEKAFPLVNENTKC